MEKKDLLIKIPQERIGNKILLIRGKKVMLDRDLAELYGVETRVLNQAVRRNIKRFPNDFMFQLTKEEMNNWISQIVTSNSRKMGIMVGDGVDMVDLRREEWTWVLKFDQVRIEKFLWAKFE